VHLPLVVATDGSRLAKRTGGASVRALRDAGIAPEAIVGRLAHGLGMTRDDVPRPLTEVLGEWRTSESFSWPTREWRVPAAWGGDHLRVVGS
jgi:glutamyl-tRNA synthetase